MELEDLRAAHKPSRIVVADDHPLFRSALKHILEDQPDLEVVAEAVNGRQALELCRRLVPDLVLMDLSMPQMDGVAATRAIKRELSDTPVLVLTALEESAGLSESLEAGAAGYVLKSASPAQITDAVRRVLAGGSPLDEGLAMQLLMSLLDRETQEEPKGRSVRSSTSERPPGKTGGSSPADDSLTPRETEVLGLVVRGQSNQQIARTLSISVSTVKRHMRHISAKLGVCDRVQAAVRAVELSLLDERNGG